MTKKNIGIILLVAAVAAAGAGLWYAKRTGQPPSTIENTPDRISQNYQIWSAKLTGTNVMPICQGQLDISGSVDILFSMEFEKLLQNQNRSAGEPPVVGTAEFSSVTTEHGKHAVNKKVYPMPTRMQGTPASVEASWVVAVGNSDKKQIRFDMTSTDMPRSLILSECMSDTNGLLMPIFRVIFTGQFDAGVITGTWVSVNDNAPEEHSHGEFRMELAAGAKTAISIGPPQNPRVSFADSAAVLKWQTVPGIKSYDVYVSVGTKIDSKSATKRTIETNAIDISGLAKGTPYAFAVAGQIAHSGENIETKLSETIIGVHGEPLTASSIALGARHACAITIGGEVICWGANGSGQLGNSQISTWGIAVGVPGIKSAKAISAGEDFSCAVLADGHVTCWGSNNKGELNIGPKPGAFGPSTPNISNAVAINSYGHRTCVTLADDQVTCWGEGTTKGPTAPVPHIKKLVQTKTLACALNTKSEVWCWDVNGSKPTLALAAIEELVGNAEAVCALNARHRIQCWVEIRNGKINQIFTGLFAPTKEVADISHFSINERMACATFVFEGLTCWGANDYWQLGSEKINNTSDPLSSIVVVGTAKGPVHLGADFVCMMNSSNNVFCRGSNQFGQLGNGSGYRSSAPVQVLK